MPKGPPWVSKKVSAQETSDQTGGRHQAQTEESQEVVSGSLWQNETHKSSREWGGRGRPQGDWRGTGRQGLKSGVWTVCLTSHQTDLGSSLLCISQGKVSRVQKVFHHSSHSLLNILASKSHLWVSSSLWSLWKENSRPGLFPGRRGTACESPRLSLTHQASATRVSRGQRPWGDIERYKGLETVLKSWNSFKDL